MPLPTSATPRLGGTLDGLLGQSSRAKNLAANSKAQLAAGPVTSDQIFSLLDNIRALIVQIDLYAGTSGIDAYATAQIPNYTGTITTEVATTRAALQACIAWVVSNFPVATTWLQSHQLNADGTRTPRNFSPAQTAGLQTALQGVLDTIA